MRSAVLIATLVAASSLVSAQCRTNGGQKCGPYGCYFPDTDQSCCGATQPNPTVCSQGQKCCAAHETNNCCQVNEDCCYGYQLQDMHCINPTLDACCTKAVQMEIGQHNCPLTCDQIKTNSVCTSSWGKSLNCSWSENLYACYDAKKYVSCGASGSPSHTLCDASTEQCCVNQLGTASCCPISDGVCDPSLATGCRTKNTACTAVINKTVCAMQSDCAWCGACYNKTGNTVNECCEGTNGATSAPCGGTTPYCCNSGATGAGSSATCCGENTRCCVDYRSYLMSNTTSAACATMHCCPKHIQEKHDIIDCSKKCVEMLQESLCTDASWNPNCAWSKGGQMCYEKTNPPCSNASQICVGSSGGFRCCDANSKCVPNTGCVPKDAKCSYWDNDRAGCSAVPDCYRCFGSGNCVNTTAGECCPSSLCTDKTCCMNSAISGGGCCGYANTTCCSGENNLCCRDSNENGFCCKGDTESCGPHRTCVDSKTQKVRHV